jgi:V/A-type H+-transporting ATPase subunit I
MTMLCGVLLNTCFGMPIFGAAGIKGAILPFGAEYFSPLGSFEGPKGTEYPAIGFALLIGYLQMNMAMILQLVNRIQRNEARTAILPLSWMMMFFGIIVWEAHANWFDLRVYDLEVSRLHIGRLLLAIPEMVGKAVCLGGVVLMFLSNLINGTANVAVRPLLFLWHFYNVATGNIGYLISYIRLFALGLTTGLLAATFNNLALSFISVDGVLHWASPMVIFTILLLAVGHALVFVLGLVGAFVHPLRLTFVEFYQTLQFSGGGIEYRPLNRNN